MFDEILSKMRIQAKSEQISDSVRSSISLLLERQPVKVNGTLISFKHFQYFIVMSSPAKVFIFNFSRFLAVYALHLMYLYNHI